MVKNTMFKPLIVRIGGKLRLRKTIIDMLPEHTCYEVKFVKEEHLLLLEKLKLLKSKFILIINDYPKVRE